MVLDTMLDKDQLENLKKFARDHAEIVAVYVFGSVATDRARRGSDLDISIMTCGEIAGKERVNMETILSNLLSADVDLVVFGKSSPLLQHQILKYGSLIYESDASLRVVQEVAARNAYLDTDFLFKEIR
jgi:uncharacterized protein